MKLQITFNILLLVTLSYSAPYNSVADEVEELFENSHQQLHCTLNSLDELCEEYKCVDIWAGFRPTYLRTVAEFVNCDELINRMELEAIYNRSDDDDDVDTPYST